jgi:hypothetical protein
MPTPIVGVNVLVLVGRKDLELITKVHAQTFHLGHGRTGLRGHRVTTVQVQNALFFGHRNRGPPRHGVACPQEQGHFFSGRRQSRFDIANRALHFALQAENIAWNGEVITRPNVPA